MHLRALTLSLILPLTACDLGKDTGGLDCTQIGCVDGLTLQMKATDPGDWTFELELDGVLVTCLATLPFPEDLSGLGCDDSSVSMTFSGTALEDSAHELGDFYIEGSPASVVFRAFLDGNPVSEQSFTPTYAKSAPNGEECGPICYSASESLGTL